MSSTVVESSTAITKCIDTEDAAGPELSSRYNPCKKRDSDSWQCWGGPSSLVSIEYVGF